MTTKYAEEKESLGKALVRAKDIANSLRQGWLQDAISGDLDGRSAATQGMVIYELITADIKKALEKLTNPSRYAKQVSERAEGLTSAITELHRKLERS